MATYKDENVLAGLNKNVIIATLEKLKDKISLYEGDCRLSGYEHPNCKKCTDNVFNTIYKYIDEIEKEIE